MADEPNETNDTGAPDLAPVESAKPISDAEQAKLAALAIEREEIEHGKIMADFLAHPVISKAFADLGKVYYRRFVESNEPEARDEAWALSRALLDLAKELRSVIGSGRTAEHARQVRLRRERVNERRPKRRGS